MADEHLQHLMQLIETKQVYTSFALLKKIPADTYIPGKQKIHDELRATLVKGKAIHAILQNSRNNGDYPAALKQGEKLQKIVPDYPNLKHDLAAIRATLKKLESIVNKAKIAASHGRKQEVIELLQTVRQIDAEHPDIPLIEKTVRRKAQGKSVKSIVVSILIIVVPCVLFGVEKIMVWRAQEHLNNATQQISRSQFKEARQAISRMEGSLRFVQLFGRLDKEALIQKATSLQSSMTFVQGMRGRVMHDGEFISEKKKKIITKLEGLMLTADHAMGQGEWQEALGIYNETLEFIDQHQQEVGTEQPIILEKIAELTRQQEEAGKQKERDECLALVAQADEAYARKEWGRALVSYQHAFDFAKETEVGDGCLNEETQTHFNQSMIADLLQKGDALLGENNPAMAVDHYLEAVTYAKAQNMDAVTILDIQSRIDNLKEQLFMARVRLLLREGDSLIKAGDLEGGLSKYNFGLTMLESTTELIEGKKQLTSKLVQKIQHLEKTAILAAHIHRLEQTAEADLRKYFDLPPQDKLEKVTIVLSKQDENLYTYCISGQSIREKVKYEIFYQIDENTGEWKIVQ